MRSILFIILSGLSLFASGQTREQEKRVLQIGWITGGNLSVSRGSIGPTLGLLFEYEAFPKLSMGTNLLYSEYGRITPKAKRNSLEWMYYVMYKPFQFKVNPVFGFGPSLKDRDEIRLPDLCIDYFIDLDIHLNNCTITPEIRYSNSWLKEFDLLYFSLRFKKYI